MRTIRKRLDALLAGKMRGKLPYVRALVRLSDGTEKEVEIDAVPEDAVWLDVVLHVPDEAGQKTT
ncbi:MAG: hypothetical protein IKO07_13950 [Clostridia bacterium]|nr:hypothetical protein [Clostridia bacterium]